MKIIQHFEHIINEEYYLALLEEEFGEVENPDYDDLSWFIRNEIYKNDLVLSDAGEVYGNDWLDDNVCNPLVEMYLNNR